MHGLQKRLEADEVVLQTPISAEEQEGRILPTGKMSREAMRRPRILSLLLPGTPDRACFLQ